LGLFVQPQYRSVLDIIQATDQTIVKKQRKAQRRRDRASLLRATAYKNMNAT
jgi:hypothetical protein